MKPMKHFTEQQIADFNKINDFAKRKKVMNVSGIKSIIGREGQYIVNAYSFKASAQRKVVWWGKHKLGLFDTERVGRYLYVTARKINKKEANHV